MSDWSALVMLLRYIENVEISVRYRYVLSPAEISKFSIYRGIDFLIDIIFFAEFSQSRLKF